MADDAANGVAVSGSDASARCNNLPALGDELDVHWERALRSGRFPALFVFTWVVVVYVLGVVAVDDAASRGGGGAGGRFR